jgi:hypothetical protein
VDADWCGGEEPPSSPDMRHSWRIDKLVKELAGALATDASTVALPYNAERCLLVARVSNAARHQQVLKPAGLILSLYL